MKRRWLVILALLVSCRDRPSASPAPSASAPLAPTGTTTAAPPPPPPPVSPASVTQLALGDQHSCALHADGLVSCWGDNQLGQLGDGTTERRATPVRAVIDEVVEISARHHRTCARRREGAVFCWGAATRNETPELRPARIAGVVGATRVEAGCAIVGGKVRCFRRSNASHEIDRLDDAVHIASNEGFDIGGRTCVARANGGVACWKVGEPPEPVHGVTGAIAVAVGDDFACALRRNGAVTCWGGNGHGQLGRGPLDNVWQKQLPPPRGPGAVAGARDAVELVAVGARACIRTSANRVACWGITGTESASRSPGAIELAGVEASALALGGAHTCVIGKDATVSCWGRGSEGQLGMGWTAARTSPIEIAGVTDAVAVTASHGRTCARRRGGTVVCWGLGDPTAREIPGLVDVLALAGSFDPCARDARGRVTCLAGLHASPVPVSGIDDAVDLGASITYGCAVRATGSVICWGKNLHGEFGNGKKEYHDVIAPREAAVGVTDAIAIAAGAFHACIVRKTGEVACSGDDLRDSVLDDGEHLTPAAVPGLADARAIVAGLGYVCALRASGRVACWGSNHHGQLGDHSTTPRNEPENITGLDGVVQIAGGDDTVCARGVGGELACWGRNTYGEVGDGTTGNRRLSPVKVVGVRDAVDVSTADGHTCAVLKGGAVVCWGCADHGEVGTHAMASIRAPTPVAWPGGR